MIQLLRRNPAAEQIKNELGFQLRQLRFQQILQTFLLHEDVVDGADDPVDLILQRRLGTARQPPLDLLDRLVEINSDYVGYDHNQERNDQNHHKQAEAGGLEGICYFLLVEKRNIDPVIIRRFGVDRRNLLMFLLIQHHTSRLAHVTGGLRNAVQLGSGQAGGGVRFIEQIPLPVQQIYGCVLFGLQGVLQRLQRNIR
ncbi:hypothetical protein D3C73_651870 [compost metagenome]